MPPPAKVTSTNTRAKSPNSWRRIGEGTATKATFKDAAGHSGSRGGTTSGLPFRPSGPTQEHVSPSQSPVRTKYWYANTNQSRKTSNKENVEEGQQKVLRPSTEYGERFVEWDGVRHKASPPRPSITNLHSFAVDSNTSKWHSENQNAFVDHSAQAVDPSSYEYPAGRSSKDFDRNGSATDLITRNTEADKIEPANFKGDLVRQPSNTKHRVSEHDGRYQWPVVQHDFYAPSKDMQNLGLDGKMYKAVGPAPKVSVVEESDYERRLTELRRKQKGIQSTDAPVAGRPSKPTTEEDVPEQSYYPYDLGTSEYKMKFKEWPLDAPPAGVASGHGSGAGSGAGAGGPTGASRVFPGATGDAYSGLRQASLYRESFPAYDAQDMSTAVPKVDGRANDSHKPPAFAWSLVDGEKPRIPPEHHDPAHSQMGESEYTRKYHWPTAEQYRAQQQQQAQRRGSGDRSGKDTLAATLFPVDSVSPHAVQPLLSEYQQQYYDKDIFGNDARPPASPKRDSNAPKQFAWALSNNGAAYSQIDEDADDTKVKRLRPATSDLSEHTNKYKWPVGAEAHHVIRKPDESHALKVGKVFALDDDQQDPRGWATEYDEKFHKLRQRQRALAASVAANTGDEHVAGVPTAARPAIPSNFAWKETDVPPPPVTTRVPKHVSPDHFHTEYEEKFLAWKNAQAATSAKRDDTSLSDMNSSKLNLFVPQSYAAGPVGAKSEYDDRYRFLVPGDRSGAPGGGSFIAKGKSDSDAPPQFAWPLVDQPRVLPPPSPTKPSKPLEKSEYETKFLWPTQTQPVKSFKPQADPTTVSTAPPMAIEEGATAAQWKSETQDPTAASKKPKKAGTSPTVAGGNHSAGLVYVRDEDVPSFFAWADAEAQKVPVVMPPPPPEQPVAIVKSEMHSEFRGHSPATAPPAKLCRPVAESQVTRGNQQSSVATTPLASEYQANFIGKDAAAAAKEAVKEAPVAGVPSGHQQYRPPQFAWPRVDPPVPPVVVQVDAADQEQRKFSDHTEHGSRYLWPTGTVVMKPGKATSSAAIDHFEGNVTLVNRPEQGKSSEWMSEYDARCAETLQSRSSSSSASSRARASSAPPSLRRSSATPPFFVWSATDAAQALPTPPPLPKPAQNYATETSEYREHFIDWQEAVTSAEEDRSHLRGTHKARPEQAHQVASLLCDPPTATRPAAHTTMQSEYDANFVGGGSDVVHVGHTDMQRPTLAYTNLDKYTPMPPPPPAPIQVKVNPNAAMQFRTEYSDHFTWQAKSPTAATSEDATTANNKKSLAKKAPTNRMKAQAVAVKKSIPHRSDANKEQAGTTLQSTINQLMDKPPGTDTTEYRRQFSWPDASRKANDIELEREGAQHAKIVLSEAQRRQRLQEQKRRFHLMSKSMSSSALRDNHFRSQPYNDGKDHGPIRLPTFGRADRFPGNQGDGEKNCDLDTSGFYPHQTVISQDSLNAPSSSKPRSADATRPSTTATSTTATIVSESECASMNQTTTVSSSSAGRPAYNKVMPGSPVSVSTNPSSPPPAAVAASTKEPAYIPGLRDYDPQYRSRSAPPRKVVGTWYADSALTRSGIFTDQTPSNPVLMHRRYPSVSDRQRTRWSTETRDQFTNKVVTPRTRVPPSAVSPK